MFFSTELCQFPENPDLTQDTRFCLVFEVYWANLTNVQYNVQLGSYTCTLDVWKDGETGPNVNQFSVYANERPRNYSYTCFSLQLFGVNDRVQISTTHETLNFKKWTFDISKTRQLIFDRAIAGDMAKCIEALEIKGTHKLPSDIPTPTDRCVPQHFRLSYPPECTSLPFARGWKRGQTVTGSTWTVAYVPEVKAKGPDCIDLYTGEVYSVIHQVTDRYLYIERRQLRHGLNRICNQYLLTVSFGPENNPREYGPYSMRTCVSLSAL